MAEDPTDRLQELERENQQLKQQLETYDRRKRISGKVGGWFLKRGTGVLLGWRLKESIAKLFEEIAHKSVSHQTLSDVASHVLWRFTRIGVVGIILALLPTIFLILQTNLLQQQNRKIDLQNERMVQQTYLQEAERRSSLIFLFSDVMGALDGELKSGSRKLSSELVGRITALSHAFKPYTYLDGDSLISQPTSPERGQLLLALIESNLDSSTYKDIFQRSNFSHAELAGVNLSQTRLTWINLSYANLRGADLSSSDLKYVQLKQADLSGANLKEVDLSYSFLEEANFTDAILTGSIMKGCIARKAVFVNAQLLKSDIRYSTFEYANLSQANLTKVVAYNPFLAQYAYPDSFQSWHQMKGLPSEARQRLFSPWDGNQPLFHVMYDSRFPVSFKGADLFGADLTNSVLSFANFEKADLREAQFCSFYFHKVKLDSAKLSGTVFNRTHLEMDQFIYSLQNGADLVGVFVSTEGNLFSDLPLFWNESKKQVDQSRAITYFNEEAIDFSGRFCARKLDFQNYLLRGEDCAPPERGKAKGIFNFGDLFDPNIPSIQDSFPDRIESLFQALQNSGEIDESAFWFRTDQSKLMIGSRKRRFNVYCYLRLLNSNDSPVIRFNHSQVGDSCSRVLKLFPLADGLHFFDDLSLGE